MARSHDIGRILRVALVPALFGCAASDALTEPPSAPTMPRWTSAPVPNYAMRATEDVAPGPGTGTVKAAPVGTGPRDETADFDVLLARPAGLARSRWTRSTGGRLADDKGETITRAGDTYFSSDGTWTRRSGDSFVHSDGTVTVRHGDIYVHSDGSWSQRVGDTLRQSNGAVCVVAADTAFCR